MTEPEQHDMSHESWCDEIHCNWQAPTAWEQIFSPPSLSLLSEPDQLCVDIWPCQRNLVLWSPSPQVKLQKFLYSQPFMDIQSCQRNLVFRSYSPQVRIFLQLILCGYFALPKESGSLVPLSPGKDIFIVRYHSGGSMELNACILLLALMVYL